MLRNTIRKSCKQDARMSDIIALILGIIIGYGIRYAGEKRLK